MIRRNKYGNRKTESHGQLFDSKLEARRYDELVLLQLGKEIADLARQVRVPLDVNGVHVCYWIPDFQYWDKRHQGLVWEDAKGKMTDVASIKIKLAKAIYPDMRIEIWRG